MEKTYRVLKLVLLVLVFVALMLGAYMLYSNLSDQVQPDTLATQPAAADPTETTADYSALDFTVYDIDGNPYKLSDFEGKPVILNFWASWCGPCKSEMPDFEEKYQEYGDTIQFLMVNLTDNSQETVETASKFIAGQGYTFPVFYDTDISAAMAYGIYSIPVTYFIDANGDLITYGQGAMSASVLQRGIDMLLGTE
ncbi:MAG: TlpA family protein disulfide reductase [Oscillospiraceae bacterium]|nr:TlpA family protein disulfide reductase [Oscillospiraceae bacterium]